MTTVSSDVRTPKVRSVGVLCLFLLFAVAFWGQTKAPPAAIDFAAEGTGIVQKLVAGDFSGVVARFDSYMAKDLPQGDLALKWKAFVAPAGPFVKILKTAVTDELGGFHAVVMTVSFQRAPQNNALVVFDKAGQIAGLYFGPQPTEALQNWTAPSYAASSRFLEVPLTVESAPWHLPGTLTLPTGAGPFPAVVLVPGSPPLDEDATVGPNKIFKDLAWGLASRGIAVLRYTKRAHQFGAGLGGGQLGSFTLREEVTDDAAAALSLLAGTKQIDRRKVYLLGHSLGGISVAQLAAGNSQVAGIVLMGTPAGDLLTALVQRAEDGAAAGGEAGQMAASVLPVMKKLRDGGFAPGELAEMYGERNPVGFWQDLRGFQPGRAASKLNIPVLVAVAKHDAQVPPDDFAQWSKALAGHANATVKLYPNLFHLFIPTTATGKGDVPEDWGRPAHVDSEVVNDVASWILARRDN
jgi:dienelactone hydrolase